MQLAGRRRWLLAAGLGFSACLGLAAWQEVRTSRNLIDWFTRPAARGDLITPADLMPCAGAPFVLPSSGFIGLLWADSRLPYHPAHKHSGIDIFGDGEIGEVPVYAAFDGYLTRLANWKSAVIIRHPQDPLDPSRQVWTYYAHMADRDGRSFIHAPFPPGSAEVPVQQGDLIGYQGNFNGGNGTVGLHLHFSVVRDDGRGRFLNETDIRNTLDPSPYLGMQLDYRCAEGVPQCIPAPHCP